MEAKSQFRHLFEISQISDGRVLGYAANSGTAQLLLHQETGISYTKQNSYQVERYLHTVSVTVDQNGDVIKTDIDDEENITGVLFIDQDVSGISARLFVVKEEVADEQYIEEQYLTVVTKDSKTSCPLRLSKYNSHGRVMTDDVFGFFQFSPDGR